MGRRVYICDIDGTVADLTHRLHYVKKSPKDWDGFFDACAWDKPILHIRELLHGLKLPIMYVSGRPSRLKTLTAQWLRDYKFPFYEWLPFHMRSEGDRRDDCIVKSELLDLILADGYEPVLAFDDRDRVVNMWRSRGIPCLQVAPGDF
jgi:hypothetical protein